MDAQAVEKILADSTALKASMIRLGRRLDGLCAEAKCVVGGADRLSEVDAQLDADRHTLEAERTSVSQLEAQGRDRVVLDVGGTHFATTRQTLAAVPGSMLAACFSGRHANGIKARPDGTVFIDRSPALFGYVLDFLRAGGQGQRWPQDADEEALRAEFDYFVLPWPKDPPPTSVIDAFGGELECVEMEGVVDNLVWVEASGRRAFGGSELREDDENRCGVLWDLNTGAWIHTWQSIQPGNGFMCTIDLAGDYVYVVYTNPELDRCTHVAIYSSVDGSFLRSFPLEEPYPTGSEDDEIDAMVQGNRLYMVRPQNVSVWDITSGERLWMVDNKQLQMSMVHRNGNEHVCVGMSHRKCMVFDISTGEIVYQVDGFLDSMDERKCFPVGQTLRLLTFDPDQRWFFSTYDEHGAARVPARSIAALLGSMNGYAGDSFMVGFHSAEIICMQTANSFRMHRLTFPTEFTVDITESRVVSLDNGDWWRNIVWCSCRDGSVIAGGEDGKVRVWKPQERKSQKRPRQYV